jgi:hypothetical protein
MKTLKLNEVRPTVMALVNEIITGFAGKSYTNASDVVDTYTVYGSTNADDVHMYAAIHQSKTGRVKIADLIEHTSTRAREALNNMTIFEFEAAEIPADVKTKGKKRNEIYNDLNEMFRDMSGDY